MRSKNQLVAALAIAVVAYFVTANLAAAVNTDVDADSARLIGDTCRNVRFVIRNERSVPIKIKKVKFYNRNKGRWQTEDLKEGNDVCPAGGMCFPGGNEDLRDSEGDDLTRFIFLYEDVTANSIMRESPTFVPNIPICRSGKEYGDGPGWTISGTPGPVPSGDSDALRGACKDVTFVVRNGRNVAIRIKKLKYFNRNENRWQTEDLQFGNVSLCEPGAMCSPGGAENLRDSEGDDLTKFIFLYEDINDSTLRESATFVPNIPLCRSGKEYGEGPGWTIGGTSRTVSSGNSDGLGNACKNVSFVVHNALEFNIEIVKVKYYNRRSGKWRTEDVASTFCTWAAHGPTKCTVGGKDNLADAHNDEITKIVFLYYRLRVPYGTRVKGDRDGGEIESRIFVPESPRCLEKKIYGTGQGWKIE